MFAKWLRVALLPSPYTNLHNGLSLDLLPVTLPFFRTTGHGQDWLGEKELPLVLCLTRRFTAK